MIHWFYPLFIIFFAAKNNETMKWKFNQNRKILSITDNDWLMVLNNNGPIGLQSFQISRSSLNMQYPAWFFFCHPVLFFVRIVSIFELFVAHRKHMIFQFRLNSFVLRKWRNIYSHSFDTQFLVQLSCRDYLVEIDWWLKKSNSSYK